MTLAQLGERFGVYRRAVAAHLVRRSTPLRQRGLAPEDTPEAVRLYKGGLTLVEVGLRFGVGKRWPARASRFVPADAHRSPRLEDSRVC